MKSCEDAPEISAQGSDFKFAMMGILLAAPCALGFGSFGNIGGLSAAASADPLRVRRAATPLLLQVPRVNSSQSTATS